MATNNKKEDHAIKFQKKSKLHNQHGNKQFEFLFKKIENNHCLAPGDYFHSGSIVNVYFLGSNF